MGELRVLPRRDWVIYELVDPGKPGEGPRVVYRDYDTVGYLDMIRAYPVIEQGQPGWEVVDRVYRAGRVPYVRELQGGLTEGQARAMVEGLLTQGAAGVLVAADLQGSAVGH